MPVLSNARHEAYCQARASGMSIDDAYVEAGFKRNSGNAARLNGVESVSTRVRELQQASAEKATVTAAELSDQLENVRVKAEAAGQYTAAVSAMMGRAKLHGLIIDKAQVEDVTPLKPEDRRAEIRRLSSKAGLKLVG